jgi:predicted ATP-grasp superfamily ATP-dependent carboligase
MSETLTIVGASVRAAASSAVRAGYEVRAGDLFADADLARICGASRVSRYPHGLVRVIAGPQPGAWMYTGALENHPALVDRLARIRPLLGNSGGVLRRARDPAAVADRLGAAGLARPEVICRDAKVPRAGTWLRKPVHSAGGARIAFADEPSPAAPGEYYFQRYVEGLACSAVYVAAARSSVLLGITRQLIGERWTAAYPFRYCGSIGPLDVSQDERDVFSKIGDVLARCFDLAGLFGVDAVVNKQGVWPVELNPRYTASMELVEWACEISLVELHVAACRAGRLPAGPPQRRRRAVGKAIVFAERPTMIAGDLGELWPEHAANRNSAVPWPAVADIPPPGTRIEAGWPIATVLADGADEARVAERLRAQAAALRELVANQSSRPRRD